MIVLHITITVMVDNTLCRDLRAIILDTHTHVIPSGVSTARKAIRVGGRYPSTYRGPRLSHDNSWVEMW